MSVRFVLRAGNRGHSYLPSIGPNASYVAGHPEGVITRHSSFNFHEYQSGIPGFGVMKVFGDETFTPGGTGYNMHPHHNFIIMAFVASGALTHINTIGKVRVQGKTRDQARVLLGDALAVQEAGAFAIVLELVPEQLAAAITERLRIPTIGIGAGAGCSGQVQVVTDLLGLDSWHPKHARPYTDLRGAILDAARAYASDVAAGSFPGPEQTVRMDDAVFDEVLGRSPLDWEGAVISGGIPLDRDL